MSVRYLIAWFGMMGLAIVNGAVRDGVYRARMGNLAAHQFSTVILLLLLGGYFWGLFTVWPLASVRQAWTVGTLWLGMTLAFEFGFGHWVAGQSWRQLLGAYRLHKGQLWPLIPLWVWMGPYCKPVRISKVVGLAMTDGRSTLSPPNPRIESTWAKKPAALSPVAADPPPR